MAKKGNLSKANGKKERRWYLMSIMKIYTKGEDFLEKRCHEVTKYDRRLKALVRDMRDTLIDANGVGLAAPQVGIMRRIFLIRHGEDDIRAYINPEIIEKRGEQTPIEGCLSVPGVWGRVKRPAYVKIRAKNEHGETVEAEGEGIIAQAFMHENDHLNGELFDKLIFEMVDPSKLSDD